MPGLGDPTGTRLVCVGNDHCDVFLELSEDTRLTLNQRICMQFLLDAHEAAPESPVDTVQDALCGYMFMGDAFPAAEEVLCALRFYDAGCVVERPANEDHR